MQVHHQLEALCTWLHEARHRALVAAAKAQGCSTAIVEELDEMIEASCPR